MKNILIFLFLLFSISSFAQSDSISTYTKWNYKSPQTFRQRVFFDNNVGIGTIVPLYKLSVLKGEYFFAADSNFFVYADTNTAYGGLFWNRNTGSYNTKRYGYITGMNYNIADPTDLGVEIGIRQNGGTHTAQIEFHADTTTGVGHVHIDVGNGSAQEMQFHVEAGDSSIDLSTNGTEINMTASDSLKFAAGIIQHTGQVFNVGAATFITNGATSEGRLFFVEDTDNGLNTIRVASPAALAASWNLTLPPDDGVSGQVLTTNGSGVTSWATPSDSSLLVYVNDSTIAYVYNTDTLFISITNNGNGGVGLRTKGSLILGDTDDTGNYILVEPNADGTQIRYNDITSVQIDGNNTAGNTRFLLYDVDNATLERVTVGAADSGGAGFKVLRIPN